MLSPVQIVKNITARISYYVCFRKAKSELVPVCPKQSKHESQSPLSIQLTHDFGFIHDYSSVLHNTTQRKLCLFSLPDSSSTSCPMTVTCHSRISTVFDGILRQMKSSRHYTIKDMSDCLSSLAVYDPRAKLFFRCKFSPSDDLLSFSDHFSVRLFLSCNYDEVLSTFKSQAQTESLQFQILSDMLSIKDDHPEIIGLVNRLCSDLNINMDKLPHLPKSTHIHALKLCAYDLGEPTSIISPEDLTSHAKKGFNVLQPDKPLLCAYVFDELTTFSRSDLHQLMVQYKFLS